LRTASNQTTLPSTSAVENRRSEKWNPLQVLHKEERDDMVTEMPDGKGGEGPLTSDQKCHAIVGYFMGFYMLSSNLIRGGAGKWPILCIPVSCYLLGLEFCITSKMDLTSLC
jgi:hypothetical protein